MSATETKALITQAVERLGAEVPALRQLKLAVKLELRTHGGDTPIWRVEELSEHLAAVRVDRDEQSSQLAELRSALAETVRSSEQLSALEREAADGADGAAILEAQLRDIRQDILALRQTGGPAPVWAPAGEALEALPSELARAAEEAEAIEAGISELREALAETVPAG